MTRIASLVAATVALAAAGVAVAGLAVGGSSTSVYTYRAAMSSGAERPKPNAPAGAKGLFTATVTEKGANRTIRWTLTFGGLSGKAVAAHIHRGKAGVSGGVLLPLCGPCKTGQAGGAKISSDVADALEQGLAYVNVHTVRNAPGEIRGQVKLVKTIGAPTPVEPGTTTISTDTTGGYGY
jgi:hypothetical protein